MCINQLKKWLFLLSLIFSCTANALDNDKLQQLQAQLDALSNTQSTTNPALTDSQGNALANQILAQQNQNHNLSANDVLAQITADQKRNPAINVNTVIPNSRIPMTPEQSNISKMAFNNVVKNALPMSPSQIQRLRGLYMASQYAAASSPVTPPRPTAVSLFVDLSPGATPPVIRLSQGFITSLVFIDSSGAPWPIAAYDVGNPNAFNIQWDKTSNTLMIQSTVLYTYGNLAVRLRGLNTPVMITLTPGQKAVDYRVDMRIPGIGPNGQATIGNNLPNATSSDLLNILDGIPPPNNKLLKVAGGNCQAWLANNRMYVRTRLTLLSPGWDATLSSADGMHAYQMQPTPMLLVSQQGQVIQLKVEGF